MSRHLRGTWGLMVCSHSSHTLPPLGTGYARPWTVTRACRDRTIQPSCGSRGTLHETGGTPASLPTGT